MQAMSLQTSVQFPHTSANFDFFFIQIEKRKEEGALHIPLLSDISVQIPIAVK